MQGVRSPLSVGVKHFWHLSQIWVSAVSQAAQVVPSQHHPWSLISYTAVSSLENAFKAAFGQRGELRHEKETQLAHDQLGNPWWKCWWILVSSLCLSSAYQSQQGSTACPALALPLTVALARSGSGGALQALPCGSLYSCWCSDAGSPEQENLAWQLLFHGVVATRHFYCITFFSWSEVWHSLLFKLQYCVYTGNKSLMCACYGFTVCT